MSLGEVVRTNARVDYAGLAPGLVGFYRSTRLSSPIWIPTTDVALILPGVVGQGQWGRRDPLDQWASRAEGQ